MGLIDDDVRPPLHVPDMTLPANARIGADGNVECVTCKKRLPMAQADVVGQGYRCPQCSAKAEVGKLARGQTDVGDHLSTENRDELRKRGQLYLALGAVLVVLGLALFFSLSIEKGVFRHPGT